MVTGQSWHIELSRIDEPANHRLHLTSGGGLTADWRLRSPAAGEAER